MRQQVDLARAETLEMAKTTAWAIGLIVGAALLALLGLILLLVTVVEIFPSGWRWLAALAIAVLLLAGAAACAFIGRAKLPRQLPPKTVGTLKDNWAWVRSRIGDGLS